MKKLAVLLLCVSLFAAAARAETLPYWREDAPGLASILAYVESVTDPASPDYVPPDKRIAVFDSDGTLYGELFPTYFDQCLFLQRVLHDETYLADDEVYAYAKALERAVTMREPEPDSPRSTAQMAAEAFSGFTVEEYRSYVREFMSQPVYGFEGLCYGEGFYAPMVELVRFLSENGFTVFVSSGTERTMLRELMRGTLDTWIPPHCVIGSTFSLKASGQEGEEGRSYTYKPDDQVLLEGNLLFKNQKMNKVVTIVDEIGQAPLLVFGNSSGDLAMAQYAVQHGGRAYMLLCDDTGREYGDPAAAESFRAKCDALGFGTISMRDEFDTIYGYGVVKTAAEEAVPVGE